MDLKVSILQFVYMKKTPSHLKNKNAAFRLNQAGLKKILGDLEAETMEITWEFARPVAIREVYEVMRERGKKLSYLTIMTVMNRLEEKGILKIVDTVNRANIFLPNHSKEEFLDIATGMIVESLLQDFPEQMAVHFKNHADICCDTEKLNKLAQKVETKRKKEKK